MTNRSFLVLFTTISFLLSSVAAEPVARLGVEKTGIQEISFAALQEAGIRLPKSNAEHMGISFRGESIASQIVTDPNGQPEAIRFWGEDINRHPTIGRYSADNAYLLTATTVEQPRVVEYQTAEGEAEGFPEGFLALGRLVNNEPATVNYNALQEEHEDYYFGPYFGPRSRADRSASTGFGLQGLASNSDHPSTLTLTAIGWTDLPVRPDHQLIVRINDREIGRMIWDGKRRGQETLTLQPGELEKGWNTLQADPAPGLDEARRVSPGKKDDNGLASVALSMGALEGYSLTYPLIPTAAKNIYEMAEWKAPGNDTFTAPLRVRYFTEDSPVVAWDIANARSFPITAAGNHGQWFYAEFSPLYQQGTHLWAAPQSVLPQPSVRPFHGGDPALAAAQSEFIILVHPEFRAAGEKLRNHREARGTSTILIEPDQLYDAYNHGLKDAHAIKDFLDAVRTVEGSQTESFLMLGGASFDTKSLFPERHAYNYIPALYTPSSHNPPVSADNLLSAASETKPAPTFAVGRLPARSAEEAMIMVDKVIDFENAGAAPWKHAMLFATGEKGIFQNSSNDTITAIEEKLPQADFSVTRIFPDDSEEKDYNVYVQRFADAINSGKALVSYIGHGASLYWRLSMEKGTDKWDIRIMTPENIDALQNKGMPFIAYGGTCYTNKFDIESAGSICLRLLAKDNGGAVASVSTAYRMSMTDATTFQDSFARALYNPDNKTLGQAYLAAFEGTRLSQDATATLVLLGDPSMDLSGLHGETVVSIW